MEAEGIPRGYCGFCDVCGKPGHTRHFPGAVPATGTWCDFHYWRLALTHPAGSWGCLVWLGALLLLGYSLRTACRG